MDYDRLADLFRGKVVAKKALAPKGPEKGERKKRRSPGAACKQSKECQVCGVRFSRKPQERNIAWKLRTCCSKDCALKKAQGVNPHTLVIDVRGKKQSRKKCVRICDVCGEGFTRRRSESGTLETMRKFLVRRFCTRECYNKAVKLGLIQYTKEVRTNAGPRKKTLA